MRRSRRSGYTLIELMVVVGIIGVLIALALPGFRGYVMRARASEAPSFMGEIRLREESYRGEFYEYCPADWSPATVPLRGEVTDFNAAAAGWSMPRRPCSPRSPSRSASAWITYSKSLPTSPGMTPPSGGLPGRPEITR
jgi:prepilin-type N-terminal cleavage/methylation domain-containing protein